MVLDRAAQNSRETKETSISVTLDIDGTGKTDINTGIEFIDHLLVSFAKHAMIDITLVAKSLDNIEHHLIEDTAIVLGKTIDTALGDRKGITRFGHALVPMDESLAESAIDLVRRSYTLQSLLLTRKEIESVSREDIEHFILSLVQNLDCCVHVYVKYGSNDHHKVEAAIKSLAVALRVAASIDPRRDGIPSTKGSM